jgi:hypothetical protein
MTRGRPFDLNNKFGKGRPKGSLNKFDNRPWKLLSGHDDGLSRKFIAEAYRGNTKALVMCIERLHPLRRQAPLKLKLGPLDTVDEIAKAQDEVTYAVARGDCPPEESRALGELLKTKLDTVGTKKLEARIVELEDLKKKAA